MAGRDGLDSGAVTSDAGVLMLRETDRAIRVIDRLAACFRDRRDPGRVVHSLRTLVGQRIRRTLEAKPCQTDPAPFLRPFNSDTHSGICALSTVLFTRP